MKTTLNRAEQCPVGPLFVSQAPVFEQVRDEGSWIETKATTLEGAQRVAVKRAHGATFSVRVAQRNGAGEFVTLAEMHNCQAITRRRAVWKKGAGQ